MIVNHKTLERYLHLAYPIVVARKGKEWVVWHAEFGRSAILGYGKTRTAAIRMLNKERRFFIQHLYEHNVDIPEPESDPYEEYSGKFVLRIPKDLHFRLAREAKRRGVSMNAHLKDLLSERDALDRLNELECIFRSRTDDLAPIVREIHLEWIDYREDSTGKLRLLDGADPSSQQEAQDQRQNYAKAG